MSNFVDEANIHVKGGDGGAGCVSFRREAHVQRGGPDGGDGGKGGDVWLVADRNVASLLAFRDHPFRRADDGAHGQGKKKHGRDGSDMEVPVPEGTVVKSREGEIIADLTNLGDRYLIAEGGRGGHGNARFLSNRRRAPAFAEQGETGHEEWMRLELKLLADVAIVGFPNAGKSTLISRISAAKPKIADYPFTTLVPNLGVVRVDGQKGDDLEMIVADIPGLIEGAAEGKGLGHQFLRHVERARVLLVLVDLAAVDGRSAEEQERVLLHELGSYQPDLLERPRVVYGSRSDVATMDYGGPTLSAVTGDGLPEVVGRLGELVVKARADIEVIGEGHRIFRPEPEGIAVMRDIDGAWKVHGKAAERVVALSDLTSADALAYIEQKLQRLGVYKHLSRAGVKDGETVRIATFEFEYIDEG